MSKNSASRSVWLIVVVASLGYFVDIYDLVLFNVVKKESLEWILKGSSPEKIRETGIFLFNMQMIGMLIGGLLWGIWGDKKGRLSALFGSILLYSIANLANAFVTDVSVYALVRIIAGIGLAGELGAGITLVSETMSKEKRGYGTMIIVTFGALGAVVAALIESEGSKVASVFTALTGWTPQNWQVAYIVGGLLGLMLLFLRVGAFESGMFKSLHKDDSVRKGDLRMIFFDKKNLKKYMRCILVGLPIWYTIGLLVANSQELFSKELQTTGLVKNGTAVMFAYMGLSVGDLISGILSQILRSRKKVVVGYLLFTSVLIIVFLYFSNGISSDSFYFMSFLLGAATGYWAIFVTIASEQFGTNIRSTVTNTVPNFVRGSVPVIMLSFGFLAGTQLGNIHSACIIGLICTGLAMYAVLGLEETFSRDLNFIEEIS
jgi:MFS family permease